MKNNMNLKEIYQDQKRVLDNGYMEFYNMVKMEIDNDSEYALDDDEAGELIVDLMLSNVLGEITTFKEVSELLEDSRKEGWSKCNHYATKVNN